MLPDNVKIMDGKTMEELIAIRLNKLQAAALAGEMKAGDEEAQKYIDAFGDPNMVKKSILNLCKAPRWAKALGNDVTQ